MRFNSKRKHRDGILSKIDLTEVWKGSKRETICQTQKKLSWPYRNSIAEKGQGDFTQLACIHIPR